MSKPRRGPPPLYDYYIVDGKVYNLDQWIPIHPGGQAFFIKSQGRDISSAVHSYHSNQALVMKILEKYQIDVPLEKALDKLYGLPDFIYGEDFDAVKNTVRFNWNDGHMLQQAWQKLNTKEMKEKIKEADKLFDKVAILIFILHLFVSFYGVYYEILPIPILAVILTATRTSLAAVGHYHCHRRKDGILDWGDMLFDMQYVGAHMLLADGHVMIHHMYTNSKVDNKRTIFTTLLNLPRLWRMPVNTIQKFGQFFSGMLIRYTWLFLFYNPKSVKQWNFFKHVEFLFVRFFLLFEFFFCYYTDHLDTWIVQFIVALWYNLFLIVSSHDFEESESKADMSSGQDWGEFHIKYSFDMNVVGNQYVDCFLTAGLGTHRVHHVVPNQKSGFANIVSEPIIKELAIKRGLDWKDSKNFLIQRIPPLFSFYLMAPPRNLNTYFTGFLGLLEEAFSFTGIKRSIIFIVLGFLGEGSI